MASEWDKLQHQAFLYAKSIGLPCEKLTKHYREKERRLTSRVMRAGAYGESVAHDDVPEYFLEDLKNKGYIKQDNLNTVTRMEELQSSRRMRKGEKYDR